MPQRRVLLLGLFLILAIGVYWRFGDLHLDGGEAGDKAEISKTPNEEALASDPIPVDASQDKEQREKRVQASSRDIETGERQVPGLGETPAKLAIEKRIDAALEEKNPAQAYELYDIFKTCRNATLNLTEFEDRLAKIDEVKVSMDLPPQLVEMFENSLFEADELEESCTYLVNNSETLQASLAREAEAGNEFARFIFAMWAPSDAVSTHFAGVDLMDYEAKAFELTLQNLTDKHPLGLLAMGVSYSGGTYFTPKRVSLGSAYLLAAQMCDPSTSAIASELLVMNSAQRAVAGSFEQTATDEAIHLAATKLKADHCKFFISSK